MGCGVWNIVGMIRLGVAIREERVIHNGIIENHLELKERLQAEGAVFSSETDTEIIAHLVSRAVEAGDELVDAVRATLQQLSGSYAIAVISEREEGRIVVAKNASPLVIGLGQGESFAASDIPAILPYTKEMIFLEEGDIAVLTAAEVRFLRVDGTPVERKAKTITWSPVQAEKGGFKHFMLKEIHEQPRAVEDTLRGRISLERAEVTPELMGLDAASARRIRRVVFMACGTSYHAWLVGRYWVESAGARPGRGRARQRVRARDPIVDPNDLVVAVSQSGETLDTLEAVKVARAGGANVLAVANVLESAIPRVADGAFYTHAGPEIGVASTKCFTTQLTAHRAARRAPRVARSGTLDEDERAARCSQSLLETPTRCATSSRPGAKSRSHRPPLRGVAHGFLFLGRGAQLPDRPRGRAQAQRDLVHPRRGLRRRRDEARAHRADRPAPAGAGDRARRRAAIYEKIMGNLAGGARARARSSP